MKQQEIIETAVRIAALVEREQELLSEAAKVRTAYEKLAEEIQQPTTSDENAAPKPRAQRAPRTQDSAKDRVKSFVLACVPGAKLTPADVTTALGIPSVLAGNYLSRLAADGAILTREGRGAYVVTSSKSN